MSKKTHKLILWFKDITIDDIALVGGKNASLGEMYSHLTKQGVKIPNGFATTSLAYWHFIEQSGLKEKIKRLLAKIDYQNVISLERQARAIRQLIIRTPLTIDLMKEVISAYQQLSRQSKSKRLDVAVRSSATAEDLPSASFAGQMESYLNIRGEKQLLWAIKHCIASLFTARGISYRQERKFDHLKIALSCGVQKMVRSDRACAGVMFSCDTETGFADVTVINSAYGLGENVVKGRVTPDEFFVFEPTLLKGHAPIIDRKLGSKEKKLIYASTTNQINKSTKNINTSAREKQTFSLTDKEVLQLARYSVIVENYYHRPMDMEWAKDGRDNKLYIVQARPETVESHKKLDVLKKYILIKSKTIKKLVEGASVGSKIGQGKARIITSVKDISKFKTGEVLVAPVTDPDWEPIMKIASAIVTDSGGRTCHSAIVSRELGIPCVVGTGRGTKVIKTGQMITVNCAEGEIGKVYSGLIPFKIKKTNIKNLSRPKTKIMMNIANPEQAFQSSFIPNDGVGLAREEFIINNFIKIHPLALINYHRLKNKKVKQQINQLTAGYRNKSQFFVDRLAEGIGRLSAAFYPKPVIVRFSDFKSNEYANLIGGQAYEPTESNPMIGWRGASRYYSPKYKSAFILECRAIKKVREEFGLTNLITMVPFCRTIAEGKKVLKIMKENGLRRGKNGFQVYVMCEVPSNVILAEQFAKIFDGFSIGTNDLTQLTLGVDRDSALIASVYDERNEAVKSLVRQVIKVAHQHKRKIGICGEAPSNYPEFTRFLVKCGIDSISLNPDSVVPTTVQVSAIENKLKNKRIK